MDGFTFRAMTWNIHGAVSPTGRHDLDRVIALIRRHEPDVVAIQEVEGRNRPGHAPFTALCEALGGHAVEAPTMRATDGCYGHTLVSRWPLEEGALHDISVPGREPRTAITARLETPAGPLRLLAAHLGLGWRERRAQAAKLAALARAAAEPMLAMGDFNDWEPHGPVDRAFLGTLPSRTRLRSFPVARPVFALDRIYARPRAALVRSWTDRAARDASDHLPVIAEVAIGAEGTTRLIVD
ncbi:endonuclease/exonuclease/phosphatase family protein [Roseomonas populi]|uniref:Endonuclease/exonuclease/phosphatase family protein n=1 Tax=Roseomonas populi TaxID=3121582 RepID=A0ABT1X1I3_9PROT|nr:endonuclease/exonuclease/phosphatase family protein [Roseomonas pecuniae]MCR0981943.1 endonuclease/exonuclease/phosphatase family protein [Roseomonas pecuniae]